MAKKIKKAILAGLTAYAAAKMMKSSKAKAALSGVPEGKEMITKKDALVDAISGGTKFPKRPEHLGDYGKGMDHMLKKPWWKFWKEGGSISASTWKKHGGSIRTEHARVGKMIKAAQGTYAKSGKMLKARHGTEVRTMGSTPHVPTGGSVSIATKLNGTLKTRTF